MQTAGITLLLDLYDCKSPALNNEAVLEQLLVSALQFAGLEVVEQVSHRFPSQGAVVICILRDAYAALQVLPGAGLVAADVSVIGKPEAARAALEIVRGYLAQKLIARSVNARWIERGVEARTT
ncbi:MAG: S-adenosylmethionine decarboxylase [Anaerolineales bacterium]|nr:S-adenosylmethionine decarboxylase [Anaerolineales bacterium]